MFYSSFICNDDTFPSKSGAGLQSIQPAVFMAPSDSLGQARCMFQALIQGTDAWSTVWLEFNFKLKIGPGFSLTVTGDPVRIQVSTV